MNQKKRKKIRILGKLLFLAYLAFLVYFLIFSDWYGRTGELNEYRYNFVLFEEIQRFWKYRNQVGFFAMFTNLFGNVLIFVPFGFFLPMASKYRSFFSTLFYSFGISLCVETFQLATKVGCFDVDDLVLNTLGGVVGYLIFIIVVAIRSNHRNDKNKKKR